MICLNAGYKLYLCLTWGWQPVALSGLVTCILIILLEFERGPRTTTLVWIGLLLLGASLMGNLRSFAAAAMSGDLPCLLPFRTAPSSRQAMLEALGVEGGKGEKDRLVNNLDNKRRVSVVGSGFGYWSWRQGAPFLRRRVYTHNLTGLATAVYGIDPEEYLVFYAGTTIYQASRLMDGLFVGCGGGSRRERLVERAGKTPTFWSHPSISTISLGAWFACSGHGNGGPAGNPSSKGLCFVEIVDVQDGTLLQFFDKETPKSTALRNATETESVYKEIRKRFDSEEGRYVIIAVGFRKPSLPGTLEDAKGNTLAPNVIVQKKLCTIDIGASRDFARAQCDKWLDESAVLRVLFIGRARPKLGLGIVWVAFDEMTPAEKWPTHRRIGTLCISEGYHIDEHDCSRDTRAAQADTCSLLGGFFEEDPSNWKGVSLLSEANIFTPLAFPPLLGVLVPLLGFYNFEVVCKPGDGKFDADKLYTLLNSLSKWHRGKWNPLQSGYGRTEIRSGSGGGPFVWIDFAVTSASFKDAFKIVLETLEPKRIALHTGKYKSRQLEEAFKKATGELVGSPSTLSSPFEVFFSDSKSADIGAGLFRGLAQKLPLEMRRV